MGLFDWFRPKQPRFGLEFVDVPAGKFRHKGREIRITSDFQIARTLFTVRHLDELARHLGKKPAQLFDFPDKYTKTKAGGPDMPIHDGVFNFRVAAATTTILTEFEQKAGRLRPGWVYRLPTEAEYEYAAAGPQSLPYPWGKDWKEEAYPAETHAWPVGNRPANVSWCGALDMLSPVSVWCLDDDFGYGPHARDNDNEAWKRAPADNPLMQHSPSLGCGKVNKGGKFRKYSETIDNTWRYGGTPGSRWCGLRIIYSPIDHSYIIRG